VEPLSASPFHLSLTTAALALKLVSGKVFRQSLEPSRTLPPQAALFAEQGQAERSRGAELEQTALERTAPEQMADAGDLESPVLQAPEPRLV